MSAPNSPGAAFDPTKPHRTRNGCRVDSLVEMAEPKWRGLIDGVPYYWYDEGLSTTGRYGYNLINDPPPAPSPTLDDAITAVKRARDAWKRRVRTVEPDDQDDCADAIRAEAAQEILTALRAMKVTSP